MIQLAAKLVSELPVNVLAPILFVAISYPMVNLVHDSILFMMTIACLVLSTLAAQAMGLVVGCVSFVYTYVVDREHHLAGRHGILRHLW